MAKTKLTAGEVAPQFTLRAIGSGRQVGPATVGGAALLLVFHDQNSVEQVQTMQEAVRARCPDASRLLVASVVNMSIVPTFLRSMAESVMQAQYAKAAAVMPAGLDAADYIVILTDWDGKVSSAYGAKGVDRAPLAVLLDPLGTVQGVHQGKDLDCAAPALIAGICPDAQGG